MMLLNIIVNNTCACNKNIYVFTANNLFPNKQNIIISCLCTQLNCPRLNGFHVFQVVTSDF